MTAAGRRLGDDQRLQWLRLIRTPNVGPSTFRDLINRFGSADMAIENLPDLARRVGGEAPRVPSVAEAEREMATALRAGAAFVAIGEAGYPPLLASADHPPPLLAVKGRAEALALPALAVVGARNASLSGIKLARSLAGAIGMQGYVIVSGLARGIDTAAHEASLDTGTVAVLAGGLDRPYPPENERLCAAIAERGAVISEMPFGWEPRARDFPRRNRLVAGMSLGLLVVEAARRSGSLISARLAAEMGRLVFAVPGSPLDPRAEGTNGLLKSGAILVTNAADVLDALEPQHRAPRFGGIEETPDLSEAAEPAESDRARIIEALGPVPTDIDDLIRHCNLPAAQVYLVLLELDLAGRLERHSGGAVSLLLPHP
jgi:DNA processing protein